MASGVVGVGTEEIEVGSGVRTGVMFGVVGTDETGVGTEIWMGDPVISEVAGEKDTEEEASGEQPGVSAKVAFIRGITSLLILIREALL